MNRPRVVPVLLVAIAALVAVDVATAQVLARGVFANGVTTAAGGGFGSSSNTGRIPDAPRPGKSAASRPARRRGILLSESFATPQHINEAL